jgi:hypothetical protein
MKFRNLLFAVLVFSISLSSVFAQTLKYEWVKHFYGVDVQRTLALQTNAAGHIYATGYFSNSTEFVAGNSSTILHCYGGHDIFLLKMSKSGQLLWHTHMGYTGEGYSFDLKLDDSSNVYLTGLFNGVVDLDPSSNTDFLITSGNPTGNGFVAKYDSSGVFKWGYKIGGSEYSWANRISLDDSNNVYLSGFYKGTIDFDAGPGTASRTSNGDFDAYILKLDKNGLFKWVYTFGGTSADAIIEVAFDGVNGIYAAGSFRKYVDFNPNGPGGEDSVMHSGGLAGFILRLGTNGSFEWVKTFKTTNTSKATDISVDAASNLIVGGDFTGSGDFDPGSSTQILSAPGLYTYRGWFAKFTPQGNLTWLHQLNTSDIGNSYAANDGSIYLTGTFTGTVDLVTGPVNFNVTSRGNKDIFITKHDPTGNTVWGTSFGGTQEDNAWTVYADADGSCYIGGDFTGTANFNTALNPKNLSGLTGPEAYIVKYSSAGNLGGFELDNTTAGINIAPNPSNGSFKMILPENLWDAEIKVFSALGAEVEANITQAENGFYVTLNAAAGVYWVQVLTPTQTFVEQIVIR